MQCPFQDMIKKHLLHSVREEMDAMKGKLSALESKIYRLEMENTLLLREYVPAEILAQKKLLMCDTRSDAKSLNRAANGCALDTQEQTIGAGTTKGLEKAAFASATSC